MRSARPRSPQVMAAGAPGRPVGGGEVCAGGEGVYPDGGGPVAAVSVDGTVPVEGSDRLPRVLLAAGLTVRAAEEAEGGTRWRSPSPPTEQLEVVRQAVVPQPVDVIPPGVRGLHGGEGSGEAGGEAGDIFAARMRWWARAPRASALIVGSVECGALSYTATVLASSSRPSAISLVPSRLRTTVPAFDRAPARRVGSATEGGCGGPCGAVTGGELLRARRAAEREGLHALGPTPGRPRRRYPHRRTPRRARGDRLWPPPLRTPHPRRPRRATAAHHPGPLWSWEGRACSQESCAAW